VASHPGWAEVMGLYPGRPSVRVASGLYVYVEAAMLPWSRRVAPDRLTLVEMLVRALGADRRAGIAGVK